MRKIDIMMTREEKFKEYRAQLSRQNDKSVIVEKEAAKEEIPNEKDIIQKKNTLTMSIDEIIEAHDEYTMIIEKKTLDESIKKQKKELRMAKLKKVLKYLGIGFVLLLMVIVLVIIILAIWK